MKSFRFLSVCVVLVAVMGLVQGCSRGPSEEDLKLAVFQEQFAALEAGNNALVEMRAEIDVAEAALVELQAIPENKLTDEQKIELEEAQAGLESSAVAREAAFEEVQGLLADFLNIGINDYPESQETADALLIYADEAILVADDMVVKSGDYKKAIDHLRSAEGYFNAAGLTPYHPVGRQDRRTRRLAFHHPGTIRRGQEGYDQGRGGGGCRSGLFPKHPGEPRKGCGILAVQEARGRRLGLLLQDQDRQGL